MANADLDKQPDSVSSVLKVFGILQALGEEREIGITELSQRVMMSKSTVFITTAADTFDDHASAQKDQQNKGYPVVPFQNEFTRQYPQPPAD